MYTATVLFTHSDLQTLELGGSTQKTLWQLCQVVVVEQPGGSRDQTEVSSVRMYIAHVHKDQTGR